MSNGGNGKWLPKFLKTVMKSHRVQLPKYDLPIRLRPWFVLFTVVIMLCLAFLGFTNFSRSLPLNDKLLHFICFCIATAVFYFIFDVDEDARRIWFWRNSGLIFTAAICFFCGGILSEFVQAALPYKEFQFGDMLANILGSSVGLYVAYHLEKHYRRRQEIARLYRPLAADVLDDEELEDDAGTQLLPIHSSGNKPKSSRTVDIWDSREELFGIGDDEDDEAAASHAPNSARNTNVPKIHITPTV